MEKGREEKRRFHSCQAIEKDDQILQRMKGLAPYFHLLTSLSWSECSEGFAPTIRALQAGEDTVSDTPAADSRAGLGELELLCLCAQPLLLSSLSLDALYSFSLELLSLLRLCRY